MFYRLFIDQCCGKTTIHNRIRYSGKNGKHRNKSIIIRGKDSGNGYTKSHTNHLLDEIADPPPK